MKKILPVIALAALAVNIGCSGADGYKTVANKEFSRIISDPQTQLVDVRTADEFKAGHIPGALNINVQLTTFAEDCDTLDVCRPVAVYCRSGVRSVKAAQILAGKGFEVYNLKEGILSWDGPKTDPETVPENAAEPAPEGNLGHRHADEVQ